MKPVAGSVKVAVAGVVQTLPAEFTVEEARGIVTLNLPPALGAVVTAGCEFDVPVRFDTDRISASIASFQAGEVPAVPVIEVRLSPSDGKTLAELHRAAGAAGCA